MQSLLGSNSSNPALSTALANFQSAWTQFSAAPEARRSRKASFRLASISRIRFRSLASGVTSLDKQVTSDITTTVSSLNTDLANVASLNHADLRRPERASAPTGDLEDARDQAINKVAAITSVTVLSAPKIRSRFTRRGACCCLMEDRRKTFTYNGTDVVSRIGTDRYLVL